MRSSVIALRFAGLLAAAATIPALVAGQAHNQPPGAGEQLGAVHFPTSCASAVASQFDRAVALLHSFEFGASTRAFTEVLAVDSTCAMAHWGVAMSRWSNPTSPARRATVVLDAGRASAESAVRLSSEVTARERGYARAVSMLFANHERLDQRTRVLAYERAMTDLVAAEPADTEARIFHALALIGSAPPTDKTYVNQLKAGEILEDIWTRQPDHPGLAHYIIHAYDVPSLADKAQAAAHRYAGIAPSAAHAQHMPSHTFTRVGLWKESVETNRKSVAIALRDGSIAEALHASDYTMYAYLQMRKLDAAKAVLDGLPALEARFDVNANTGAAPGWAGAFALAAIPARYALERRDWAGAAALEPKSSTFPWTEAMVHFTRALGAAHIGATATARESVDSLAAFERRLSENGEPYWAEQVAIQRLGAQASLDRAEGRTDAALVRMHEAARREGATEKSAVTPGPLVPARELLADMLLELGRPAEALTEYRATLLTEPNRYQAVDGARRAATASGDRAAAARYAAQLRQMTGG